MTEGKCSICERPTTYMGERAAVNLRGGKQAHIYCVQAKRGWPQDRIEALTEQRMIAAGEDPLHPACDGCGRPSADRGGVCTDCLATACGV